MSINSKDRNTTKSSNILPWKSDPEGDARRAHAKQHRAIATLAGAFVARMEEAGRLTEENEGDVRAACWALATQVVVYGTGEGLFLSLEKAIVIDGEVFTRHPSDS